MRIKTEETKRLEMAIRKETKKIGVFGCFEVTIGFGGNERVDYMTYDTKGIFRCYEIKVTKSDFHSKAAKSFVGHYNYYVLTQELYYEVKDEIPNWVGVYIGDYLIKRPKKKNINVKNYTRRRSINGKSTEVTIPYTDMLKDSMIRSLYRDSDKLIETGDEQYINTLKREIEKAKKERDKEKENYKALYYAVLKKYGYDEFIKLIEERR